MSAAMMFLIVFAAAWLAVAGTTITRLRRRRGVPRDISLVARAGLLIWFTDVIAAMFEVRHWPAGEIGQMNAVEIACKLAGFAILIAGLAFQALQARSRRTAGAGSRTRSRVMQPPDAP